LINRKGGVIHMMTLISLMNQLSKFALEVDLILVSILVHKYFNDDNR